MDANKQNTTPIDTTETIESISSWIETQLKYKHSVTNIARSMVRTDRGLMIIAEWHGRALTDISAKEQFLILREYIETEFKHCLKRSYISAPVESIRKESFLDMEEDVYSEYLTELMNSKGYKRVSNHITNLLAVFQPYMLIHDKEVFKNFSVDELEVKLVEFIKKHLETRVDKSIKDKK